MTPLNIDISQQHESASYIYNRSKTKPGSVDGSQSSSSARLFTSSFFQMIWCHYHVSSIILLFEFWNHLHLVNGCCYLMPLLIPQHLKIFKKSAFDFSDIFLNQCSTYYTFHTPCLEPNLKHLKFLKPFTNLASLLTFLSIKWRDSKMTFCFTDGYLPTWRAKKLNTLSILTYRSHCYICSKP